MSDSEIFKAVIKLPGEERAAYLDQACGNDHGLRQEVQSLLQAHEAQGSFLGLGKDGLDVTEDYRPITERPGMVIGPYKLMEQIGEGGFGLVFVAEQLHPVRRKVALKVIKPGMDTRDVIARFEAERQALALMDHPNIAQVFDAGTTESGRPYFVMELVKGIPIVDYCDQQQLTPRERLELFLSVCQAVQHAHQKGIIHRDLKPSNILVAPHDGIPVVKVIDFGVAKAIGQQLTEKTIYTRFTQMVGTPLYMSPEQAELNALDVDIRSDVYSLGVLLYELLTGQTPFDRKRFATAAYDEIRRIIREEEPPRPSTRLSSLGATLKVVSAKRHTQPAKLSALIKGDLDWIVMKALEKDRNRRYETANALAADVRRFLREDAVEARPPSAWYRFRKLARRHRVALTTASLVGLALLVGLLDSIWLALRAHRAEAAAIAERTIAEEQRAAAESERDRALDAEKRERQAREAERQSRLRAEQNFRLAQKAVDKGFTQVSDNDKLKSLGLEKLRKDLLAQAKDFYENLIAEHSDEPGLQAERGRSYLRLAQITIELGDRRQAIALLDRARTLFESLMRTQPDDVAIQDALAGALEAQSDNYYETGSMQDALTANQDALRMRESLAQSGSANDRYQLAMCQSHMGMVYSRGLGRTREGEALINRAMELCEILEGENPSTAAYVVAQADILRNLGRLKNIEGDYAGAVAAFTRELALRERLASEDPGALVYQDNLGRCLMSLASQAMKIGQLARAQKCLDQAAVIFKRLILAHPDVPEHKNMLARTLVTGAQVTCRMGNYNQAITEVEKGVAMAPADGLTCGNAAFCYTSIFVAASRDTKLPRAERDRLAESQARRAIELFRQAKKAGFYQRRGIVTSLTNDPELNPLREREDFKALMRELKKPK